MSEKEKRFRYLPKTADEFYSHQNSTMVAIQEVNLQQLRSHYAWSCKSANIFPRKRKLYLQIWPTSIITTLARDCRFQASCDKATIQLRGGEAFAMEFKQTRGLFALDYLHLSPRTADLDIQRWITVWVFQKYGHHVFWKHTCYPRWKWIVYPIRQSRRYFASTVYSEQKRPIRGFGAQLFTREGSRCPIRG